MLTPFSANDANFRQQFGTHFHRAVSTSYAGHMLTIYLDLLAIYYYLSPYLYIIPQLYVLYRQRRYLNIERRIVCSLFLAYFKFWNYALHMLTRLQPIPSQPSTPASGKRKVRRPIPRCWAYVDLIPARARPPPSSKQPQRPDTSPE